MLLRFGVSNHLSIHDYQELSFVASSLKDRADGLIACPSAPNGWVVPAAVIYGANASGKSNLMDAMFTMRQMVLWSQTQREPDGPVPRHPFRLDPAAIQAPSRFDIDFAMDGVRYHYGFEATDTAFTSEWLYVFPSSHRRTLFERDGDDIRFGRTLRGRNTVIADLTRPNSLYVSAAAQNHHEQLTKVFRYFRSLFCIPYRPIPGDVASVLPADEEPDDRVIDFLQEIDTGVVAYRRNETDVPEETQKIQREVVAVVSKFTSAPPLEIPEKMVVIELAHRGRDGKNVYLELDRESAGTRRLLDVLSFAFRALDKGMPLFIDELDASLHTQASEAVLRLFCTPTTNPKGAQLIATTHDTHLMGSSALRRDQLWFTEKDADGATRLYPLTDFRTRKDDNVEKGYLQGRYGAVPFDDPISALG